MKVTEKDFINKLSNRYIYISGYKNMKSKIKIHDNILNKDKEILASNWRSLSKLNSKYGIYTKEKVEEEANKRNYTLLNIYNNKNSKWIEILDNANNKKYNMNLYNFMKGNNDKDRGIKIRNEKNKISIKEFVKNSIRNDIKDYEILSLDKGINGPITVKYIPTGDIFNYNSAYKFQKGKYRNTPWDKENERKKLENDFIDKFNKFADKSQYELVYPINYKSNKYTVKIKHLDCGKIFDAIPANFLYLNNGCPYCALKGKSKEENEVYNYVLSLYPTAIQHYKLNNNKELDIFISELKIGIEYCGLYWHSEKKLGRKYHEEKMEQANKEGIRLLTIFEDEWINNNAITKSKIKRILHKDNSIKIYGRKCIIKIVDGKDKNAFLNANHIQGEDTSYLNLGLYYNSELVAVMTFSKSRVAMGGKEKSWIELSRYASKINSTVLGGFNKLLEYFKANYNWTEIRTYADLRWSDSVNNIYNNSGFMLLSKNKPDYFYADRYHRYHRYNFRKDIIKKKFPEIYDDTKTEFEMMDKTPYIRIWDCGTLTFILKNK